MVGNYVFTFQKTVNQKNLKKNCLMCLGINVCKSDMKGWVVLLPLTKVLDEVLGENCMLHPEPSCCDGRVQYRTQTDCLM